MKGKCPGDVWRSCSEAGIVWGGERREGEWEGGGEEAEVSLLGKNVYVIHSLSPTGLEAGMKPPKTGK